MNALYSFIGSYIVENIAPKVACRTATWISTENEIGTYLFDIHIENFIVYRFLKTLSTRDLSN